MHSHATDVLSSFPTSLQRQSLKPFSQTGLESLADRQVCTLIEGQSLLTQKCKPCVKSTASKLQWLQLIRQIRTALMRSRTTMLTLWWQRSWTLTRRVLPTQLSLGQSMPQMYWKIGSDFHHQCLSLAETFLPTQTWTPMSQQALRQMWMFHRRYNLTSAPYQKPVKPSSKQNPTRQLPRPWKPGWYIVMKIWKLVNGSIGKTQW